ncbi:MAG: energy-coupling factor transporter ATPase [Defluviitaleaceae bacterium]|nr:energy-coupling factor transporter ATPase [Defluviitaleaceae bacterium]
MIEIKNLTFGYEDKLVFDGFDLTFQKGDFVALIGHNGSGKSTLSKLLVGLEVAQGGEIWIDGIQLTAENVDVIRKKVGIVFQNPDNQFVGATVADDIAFGLENRQVPRAEMVVLVDKYIKQMGLAGCEERSPHHLSGGQKQRTAIAGALAVGADFLILDEATSMLDPTGRREMMQHIRQLATDKQRTIIMITHHLDEVVDADRLVVLHAGKVLKSGTPRAVFEQSDALEAVGLELPFAVQASKQLYEQSIIPHLCLTNEELIQALWM